MKKTIKLLSVLMAVIMAVSCIGICATAEGVTHKNYNGFVYCKSEAKGLKIVNYKGNKTEIDIPEEIDGIDVTEINMKKCKGVTSISIPEDVNFIRISKMVDLKKVEIDEDNEHFIVKNNLVYGKSGKWLRSVPGGLKTVKTAVSTTKICHGALLCAQVKKVVLTKNVKIIDTYAFQDCKSLKKVVVNSKENAPKIYKHAFEGTKSGIEFYAYTKKVGDQLRSRTKGEKGLVKSKIMYVK